MNHKNVISLENISVDFGSERVLNNISLNIEDKEFITRTPNKRTKVIKTTKKGKITAQKLKNLDEKWDEKIRKTIGEEDYSKFLKTLRKIIEEIIWMKQLKT